MRHRAGRPRDAFLTNLINDLVTGALTSDSVPRTDDGRNAAAVMLGRLGGQKGGKARAAKLTAKERSRIARKGAAARWGKR
jgi:hypothetical protein